jgi:hypothetical protein
VFSWLDPVSASCARASRLVLAVPASTAFSMLRTFKDRDLLSSRAANVRNVLAQRFTAKHAWQKRRFLRCARNAHPDGNINRAGASMIVCQRREKLAARTRCHGDSAAL